MLKVETVKLDAIKIKACASAKNASLVEQREATDWEKILKRTDSDKGTEQQKCKRT